MKAKGRFNTRSEHHGSTASMMRMIDPSSREMPTTPARRSTSLFNRFIWMTLCSLMRRAERVNDNETAGFRD